MQFIMHDDIMETQITEACVRKVKQQYFTSEYAFGTFQAI